MLKIFIGFAIFCVILFFYLHIQFQLKTSNELEIYEIDNPPKEKCEEIWDLRQPVIFNEEQLAQELTNSLNMKYLLEHYSSFDVRIQQAAARADKDSNIELPIPLQMAIKLITQDKTEDKQYYSRLNQDFLKETGVIKNISHNDEYLRPPMICYAFYDILMGSNNTTTTLRYEINYRNFLFVSQGCVLVKLTPPRNTKYLYPIHDYENYEFTSPVNPWNPQPKYKAEFDKTKFLEVRLVPGKFLYIPAYWWYSLQFMENTSVCCMHYRTYMNNIAILPSICMYVLQNQNVQRKIVKTAEWISEQKNQFNDKKDIISNKY